MEINPLLTDSGLKMHILTCFENSISKIDSGPLSSSLAVTSLRLACALINMADDKNDYDNNTENNVDMRHSSFLTNEMT